MKKFFIILLSVICIGCFGAAIGCTNTQDTSSSTDSSGSTDSSEATYNLVFSYYQYEDGEIVVSDTDSSTYVEVGVTYTAVETSFGLVDIENGDTVRDNDVIKFTIHKSVFCEYTTSAYDYPLAYVNDDLIPYDSETGEYTLTVDGSMATDDGDLIVWVSNVEMMDETISGLGTEASPYTINSVTDWLYFATYINEDFYTTMNYAYWALGCDLDFEGEEVYMVGDGTTSSYAYFMGNFNGNGKTLSNFVVSNEVSDGTYTSYVGVFGICLAYSGVSAVVQNLNLENFTIEATATEDSACVAGGVVGYGMGYNVVNCSVTDCTITITGNDSSYSYGAGIIGILQSYYDEDNAVAYYSSIQYCAVNNITIGGTGVIYMAGGIAGYTAPYAESAPVYVTNNYAADIEISGAIRTGGIVGTIGRYTSVQNCYATGTLASNDTLTSTYDDYKGTQIDDTIAYAGGIAGFAENDTVITGCFFVGNLSATASLNTTYTGYIYGGSAAAAYENYSSQAVILFGNLQDNTTKITSSVVTESALKGLGWHEEDWIFSGTYPTINGETKGYSFTITINVDGTTYGTVDVDTEETSSVYVPMAYRYLLYDYGKTGGISIYLRDENNTNLRTYGYFFDAECTQRIPSGYVITGDMTIYAKYADCTSFVSTDTVTKEYYVTGNGITATIIFYASGVYSYEEGAVYIEGTYEYDGTYITFKDGYFSRLSSAATDNQASSYYNFYATINADGNLEIFDCETDSDIYTDTYSSSYDYLARFVSKSNPLLAVYADNVAFAGKYYADNGYEYTLDIDYTGTYTTTSSDTLTYTDNGDGTLAIMLGSQTWTGVLSADGSSLVSISRTNAAGVTTTYTLTAYDDFEGTWVAAGLIDRTYTFDGKGNWTYIDATMTQQDGGTYTVSGGELLFTHDGMDMVATVNDDGTVNIERTGADYKVTLYAENSIAGVWYTYSYSIKRYTLTLGGINPDGWGEAEYEGTSGFRYTIYNISNDSIVYYVYYGDSLYAYLEYDISTGILEGNFYDSDTEAYDETYTFYIYDEFYGTWVGSSADFATVTFNGFGLYNVAYAGTGTRAVKGTMTVTNTSDVTTSNITYTVDMSKGTATFTYNEVTYTLTYDAFNNTISMAYAGGTIVLEKEDEFADVVFETKDGTTYAFDGRGNLDGGGVVTITTSGVKTTATYTIDAEGIITVTGDGSTYTIYSGDSGYQTSSGMALYIQNAFTGTWAIYGWYKQITIGDVRYIYDGENIQIEATYDGESITLYYNGDQMWFTQISLSSGTVTYYITSYYGALIISTTETYSDDENWTYLSQPDDEIYGTWKAKDGATLAFDGTAGDTYTPYGEVTYTSADGETVYVGEYYYDNGQYVVVYNSTSYYYTLESSATTCAYTDGTSYLVEVTSAS